MKTIFLFSCCFLILLHSEVQAQLSGKKFISGTAMLNFDNSNPKSSAASNNYGLGFDVANGKFSSETIASGWKLNGVFGGSKQPFVVNGRDVEKNGLNELGLGGGYFWQFYKHFNEKTGVFAGPDIDLSYRYQKQYDNANEAGLPRKRTNSITLSAGLSVGLYYRFSDKWWVTGSVAFSNPVEIGYNFVSRDYEYASSVDVSSTKTQELNYRFSPSFTFPSVGLGLRYFPGR